MQRHSRDSPRIKTVVSPQLNFQTNGHLEESQSHISHHGIFNSDVPMDNRTGPILDTSPVYRSVCIEARESVPSIDLQPSSLTSIAATKWQFDDHPSHDDMDIGLTMPSLMFSTKSMDGHHYMDTSSVSQPPICFDPKSSLTQPSFDAGSLGKPSFGQNAPSQKAEPVQVVDGWKTVQDLLANADYSFTPGTDPIYLEPNTHFKCTRTARNVVDTLSEFLRARNVEFGFAPEACVFECASFTRNLASQFHVYVYEAKTGESDGVLVEFQRRSGDSFQFSELYDEAMQMLREQEKSTPEYIMHSDNEPPSFGVMPQEPVSDSSDAPFSMVHNLNDMVSSKYMEEQFEGVRALAYLSSRVENCSFMLQEGALEALVRALTSDNCESVRCCAASGVANLSDATRKDSPTQKDEDSGGLDSLRQLVTSSASLEVTREAARAMVAVLEAGDLPTWSSSDFWPILNKLEQTQDKCAIGYRKHLEQYVSSMTTTTVC